MDKIMEMDKTEIINVVSSEQIKHSHPVMQQLRLHFEDEESFIAQVKRQLTQGYRLVGLQEDGEIKALAGFRFLEFLSWGKVLYVDDLITDAGARRKGYGAKLLHWVIEEAKKAGCDQVHLDSGPQRHDAHRLYLNQGFKIVAYHFGLDFSE